MNSSDFLSQLKATMAEAWHIEPDAIPDNAALNELAVWDSLGHITMLLALESGLGLPLDEESVQQLRNIPAILTALESRRADPTA